MLKSDFDLKKKKRFNNSIGKNLGYGTCKQL